MLGKSDGEVTAKVTEAYNQLFHADLDSERIYFEVGTDEAYILDANFNDTRMDALGYGMFVTVELDHRDEFDKIWRYTKAHLLLAEGPKAGYFAATCAIGSADCDPTGDADVSVAGAFFAITALLFADARWQSTGAIDYRAEADARLLDMRRPRPEADGATTGVTSLFDATSFLPRYLPKAAFEGQFQPGALIPAFIDVWARATGDGYWTSAAVEARELLNRSLHPVTGLSPELVDISGAPIPGEDVFGKNDYSIGFNIALDYEWSDTPDARQPALCNTLLGFFDRYAITHPTSTYADAYVYDTGAEYKPSSTAKSSALQSLIGATASVATVTERKKYIQGVWDQPISKDEYRYFDGINQLFALMLLSGNMVRYR